MTKFQDVPRRPDELMLRTTSGNREQFAQECDEFVVSVNPSGSLRINFNPEADYNWSEVEFNEDSIEYIAWR